RSRKRKPGPSSWSSTPVAGHPGGSTTWRGRAGRQRRKAACRWVISSTGRWSGFRSGSPAGVTGIPSSASRWSFKMGQIQVKAPANGRVHRAEIYVLGDNGKVTFNDKADLMAVQELTKAARRLAPHVGKEPKEVEKELADLWHQALDQQRREEQARQEEAAAAATAPAKVDEGARAAALLAGMPPDVRDEAAARLRSGDLLKTVMDDIERLGVAGERP